MAPTRKRENRENQYYNVGVQGRKTGITLEDKGLRDEHGLEPISGIFSSPEKSPPRRGISSRTGGTLSGSESMDLQESSMPDLATSTKLVRSARTHLPPPKARSPMKTSLGSSPRRQSSMGPRIQTANPSSSPSRSASHPAVSRRLDFEQDESSLQETPALSGSGQRRGQRRSVYSIEPSPSRNTSTVIMEESIQEEIGAAEDSAILNVVGEESGLLDIGNDTIIGAGTEADTETEIEAEVEVSVDVEESEVISEPAKAPLKRGRKRKGDVLEPVEAEEQALKSRKRGPKPPELGESKKKEKKTTAAPVVPSRRSKRVSDMSEQESSNILDTSAGAVEEIEDPPALVKPRGRPPKAKAQPEMAPPARKKQKQQAKELENENEQPVFKKPALPKQKKKTESKSNKGESESAVAEDGKLVDLYGNPISRAEFDQMSTTSTGTRFGRGRHLSVFRELEPESVGTVGRTGRHRVKPVDFWANDKVSYDPKGNMQAIVHHVFAEPPPKKYSAGRPKGKKRDLPAIEEEDDVELEPWEEGEGIFEGIYKGYDPDTKLSTKDMIEKPIAWSQKGVQPADVHDKSFKFVKLASAGEDETFMAWGFIELQPGQMKLAKNTQRMHMVFHVQNGCVEARVFESVFTATFTASEMLAQLRVASSSRRRVKCKYNETSLFTGCHDSLDAFSDKER
ncbi:mitotic fidelity of chromosome transmission- protein [Kalmusia sp. IMI 367209]|nr:mitotic fidelity of chromosome transmission- protein [Kalmusia sp. IMI 367209]